VEVQPKSEPMMVYCVFESGVSVKLTSVIVLGASAVRLFAAAGGSQV
jgi:hypothetical protein